MLLAGAVGPDVSLNWRIILSALEIMILPYIVPLRAEPVSRAGVPSIPEQALTTAAESLSQVAQDAKGAHAATAALALGHAGLQGTLALPAGLEEPGRRATSMPAPLSVSQYVVCISELQLPLSVLSTFTSACTVQMYPRANPPAAAVRCTPEKSLPKL